MALSRYNVTPKAQQMEPEQDTKEYILARVMSEMLLAGAESAVH